jgi:hypothetical protein
MIDAKDCKTPVEAMAYTFDKRMVQIKPAPRAIRVVLPNGGYTMLLPQGSTQIPESLASHPFITAQIELV